ncbi:MAG: TerB family tellurite resistance protein [Candidatus Limnocylindrales bacterium]
MPTQDRAGDPRETQTIRAIVARLEALPPDRAAIVGGFAYVLGRIAYADLEISAAETAEMERILRDWSGLDEALAVLVVEIARHQAVAEGATEDYLVTRRFREASTPDERQQLLHCMFAVATAAGDTISAEENATIRQVADELGFTLAELNVVRRQYADRLSALQ